MKNPTSNTETTFEVSCPCGCGEILTATDAGFSAISVEAIACRKLFETGIVRVTIRKSRAIELAYPNAHAPARHRDGLVSFGGSR